MVNKPRGTVDIIGKAAKKFDYVVEILNRVYEIFAFEKIYCPTFEAIELFQRSVGETTDIVSKEMFEFSDKKNRQMALRPELTASVARAVIENKMYLNQQPLKLAYTERAFRYERPQKNRQREFWQTGAEIIGAKSWLSELEIIHLIDCIFTQLSLEDDNLFKINYLPTGELRNDYIESLKKHISKLKLCDDCQIRIVKNPLRVLDCKIDFKLLKNINLPEITEYLTAKQKSDFKNLCKYLKMLNVNFEIDPLLVRGLDYYTGFVFEVFSKNKEFSNIAIGGGGRYDELYQQLDGPNLQCVGFSIGVERLMSLLINQDEMINSYYELDLYLVALDEQSLLFANAYCASLRASGVSVACGYEIKNAKSALKEADKLLPKYVGFINQETVEKNIIKMRHYQTKNEKEINMRDLVDFLLDEKEGEEDD